MLLQVNDIHDLGKQFFDLPLDVKQEYSLEDLYGYVMPEGERFYDR